MPTTLITGANRGLGLEFARQYAEAGWRVIATCRRPEEAAALRALGPAVEIHALEVTDLVALGALGTALADRAIDVLIANAGIFIARDMTAEAVDAAAWQESFAVNAIAPLACAGVFAAHVARSHERKMLALGSLVGSVSAVREGGNSVYRSSKAALHMAWRIFAQDHPDVIAAVLSPGRARTDMNPEGVQSAADSVTGMRRVIAGLTPKDSGGFFRYDGSTCPW